MSLSSPMGYTRDIVPVRPAVVCHLPLGYTRDIVPVRPAVVCHLLAIPRDTAENQKILQFESLRK